MATKRGANEGSIFKRNRDGKWCAAIDLGYVNGKCQRRSKSTSTGRSKNASFRRGLIWVPQEEREGDFPPRPSEELTAFERLSRRGLSGFGRLRIVCEMLPAVFEPEAVAVHLEDVNVMGEPIEQRAGQSFGPEHAGPLVEREVAGDDDRAALVALAEDLEQQLGAGL